MSPPVVRRVRVADPEGFHARPCSDIVLCAKRFRSEVRIAKGEQDADARSVFELMLLDVGHGEEVEVRASGPDAEAAAAAVAACIE